MAGRKNQGAGNEPERGTESIGAPDFSSDGIGDPPGGLLTVDPAQLGNDGGSSDDGDTAASSGTGDSAGSAGSAKRGRGRPVGSGKGSGKSGGGKTQKGSPVSVSNLEKLVFSAHQMIAKFTHADIMRLDKEESQMLAQGMADVAAQYESIALSAKAQAWVAFAGVLGVVYGPRLAVVVMPKKASVHPIAPQATGTFDASQLTSVPGN